MTTSIRRIALAGAAVVLLAGCATPYTDAIASAQAACHVAANQPDCLGLPALLNEEAAYRQEQKAEVRKVVLGVLAVTAAVAVGVAAARGGGGGGGDDPPRPRLHCHPYGGNDDYVCQ
jgi:hypothetical protein